MNEALKAKLSKLSPDERKKLLARLSTQKPSSQPENPNSVSYQQEQFWLLHHFSGSPEIFNVCYSIDIYGGIDLKVLQESLRILVKQTDVFQFRFPKLCDELNFVIDRESEPAFEHRNLPAGQDWTSWLDKNIKIAQERTFDLELECPLRCYFFSKNSSHFNLCLVSHHIALDGTSFAALWKALAKIVNSCLDGGDIPERPPSIQYQSYTERQRQRLTKVQLQQNRKFWVDYLEGSQADLGIPEPTRQHHDHAGCLLMPLPDTEVEAIKRATRRLGVTENIFFLSTYFSLLAETFHQRDICLGTPTAIKPNPSDEDVIGCCINTLCLRGRIHGGMTFERLLQEVRDHLLAALSHADFPMQQLAAALNRNEREDRNLFQTMFQYRNFWPELQPLGRATCQLQAHRRTSAGFPLVLDVIKDAGSDALTLSLILEPDRFAKADGERMLTRYRELLALFVKNPSSSVLPLAEHCEVPNNEQAYPLDKTVVEVFCQRFAKQPDALAVEGPDGSLTYAQLYHRSISIAHRLVESGIQRGDVVGLCAGRSAETIAAIWGILRAGAAYLPLDPKAPDKWKQSLVADAEAKLILSSPDGWFDASIPGFSLGDIPHAEKLEPIDLSQPEGLAYIIYTSGSTGQPKGVMIAHQALTNFTFAAKDYMDLSDADRMLQFASLSFDASVEEIFPTLIAGGTLVLRNEEMTGSPASFGEYLKEQGISVMSLPTGFWSELVHSPDPTVAFPNGLRFVLIGGERVSEKAVNRWLQLPGKRPRLLNTYGPTECTVVATTFPIPDDTKFLNSIPIGKLLPNLTAVILDEENQPVTKGEPGELCLGGLGLAKGYRNQAQLTAKAFPENLVPKNAEERFYRTGDRVRLLDDGNLEFLGRLDDQLKIRGFRVEPMEVEFALEALPGVTGGCVVATKDASERDALAAYITLDEQASLEETRSSLASELPPHYQPSVWTVLEDFPQTLSRKIDRKSLPKPNFSNDQIREAPDSPNEKRLAMIWKDLLKVEQVGRSDNFFALGGHSLMVMQLFARVEETFRTRPSIVKFLDHPILSHLAADLEGSPEEEEKTSTPDHAPTAEEPVPQEDNVEQVYPASLQQRYFHDLDVFSGRDHSIIARLPFRCRGPFDVEAFRHAIERIVERHDIYRTVYRQSGDDLDAVVLNHLEPLFEIHDGEGKDERDLVQDMLQASARLWNLETDSPLHVSVRRVNDSEHLCILSFHHIACDGGSWRLFTTELDEILNTGNSPSSLEHIPDEVQFSSYAKRQRDHREAVDANMDYWMAKLRDLPPPPLPSPEPPDAPSDSNTLFQVLPNNLWKRAREIASIWQTTPHNLMMAAFHAWHFRYLGGTDTTIGTPINARLLSGDDRVHGCTVYMLPIRQQMTAEMSFFELQQSVQTGMLEAMEHAEINLLDLQAALAERDHRNDPIYAAIFQVRNLNTDLPSLFAGATTELLRLPVQVLQVPLLLQVHLDQADAAVSLCFDSERISPSAATRALNAFQILLQNLLENPKASLASQSLIDDHDRALVLDRWARNTRDYPKEESVPDLFDETARGFPNRTALVSGDHEFNYHQLNQRSKQLAAELRIRGIGRNQQVGICMERSADLIIALIAILRTGASYLPLDPEYPVNRLRFMVEDAEAAVVLTHQPCFARLRTIGRKLWLIEDFRKGDGGTSQDPFPEIASLDPAYLMYTSGTTGKPKGSLIPHRGIVRLVRGADYARFGPEETYLFLASPSFDAATFEIWAPLLNGGKLVVMPPGTPSLGDIGEIIRTQGVTTLWLTARLFDTIVDEAPEILKPLRQLLTGGDTLSPKHVARCRETHPDLILINGYGPTENTTFSCCYEIPTTVSGETPIPIGKPIANSEAFILDSHRQPVPPGSVGELYLGGDGLSLGYWKRDELNAQAFVPHPFSMDPRDRLYRTGDRARYLPDGQIEFVGRIDHQVKIRGFRVELSEIETVLGSCPVIERCSVLAMDEDHGKSLAAVLVPVNSIGDEEALTEAKEYLNENLPRHLQPDRWLVLKSLPLTPNGKLDRKALAQDFAKSESNERPIIPPESQLEEQLLEIWRRLFQSNRISTDDNFFSLGGTSLTAMRLTWEVERELGRQLPISDLFRNPTIQLIGRFLSDRSDQTKSTVVDLREGRSDRNGLFIVHGWGGEVFAQAKFIKGIPGDFPVYGVQAVELSGENECLTSFEEMARRYAKDIVARQPNGPYYLCGFSLGGIIAYETARQLHRQGKEIGRLMVFDTHPKNLPFFQTLRAQSGPLVKRLAHHLEEISSGKKDLSWSYLRDRLTALRQRLRSKKPQGESLSEIEVPADSDYYSILNDRYVPKPFPVATIVFRAKGASTNLIILWNYLSKKNAVCEEISSSHLEMFGDSGLARRVGDLLK